MDKHQKDEQRHQEDVALSRALVWVGAAIVLELLLLLINKYYINVYTTELSVKLAIGISTALQAVRIIALIGIAVCGVWDVLSVKKQASLFTPTVILLGCAALCFCAHFILTFNDSGMRMLYLLVPAWAALALVYYLYQREFFFSACYAGLGVLVLWLVRHRGMSPMTLYILLAVTALAIAAGLVLVLKIRGSKGQLKLSGRTFRVVAEDANYTMMLTTLIGTAAACVLGLALGITVAYYLIYVLVAWLFCLLVYYTVKMM